MGKTTKEILNDLTLEEKNTIKNTFVNYFMIGFGLAMVIALFLTTTINAFFERSRIEAIEAEQTAIEEQIQSTIDALPNPISAKEIARNPQRFANNTAPGDVVTIYEATITDIGEDYFLVNNVSMLIYPDDQETIYDLNIGTKYIISGYYDISEYGLGYIDVATIEYTYE